MDERQPRLEVVSLPRLDLAPGDVDVLPCHSSGSIARAPGTNLLQAATVEHH
jgi:hypothetical protein